MKKQKLLKTLLVAVGLCAGASAWAAVGDVTTQANIDFSNSIVDNAVAGTVNSMALSGNFELGYNSSNTDVLRVGNGTGTVTIDDADLAGTRDEIVITFDLYFGSLSGKKAGFYLYDSSDNVIGGFYHSKYSGTTDINTFSIDASKITAVGSSNNENDKIVAATNKSTFEIHLNYATGMMYLKQSTNGTLKQTTSEVAMSSTKPLKKFVLKSDYNNANRRCWFDNLLIQTTEGNYDIATAKYTVKYVCGGVEVKEASERTGDVGNAIALTAGDKTAFFNNDESKRYIYESDDAEGKNVTDGDATVVTVTFREAEKWAYTVTTSYTADEVKNTLDYEVSNTVWEDLNSVTVKYPRYQIFGSTLVGRTPETNNLQTSVTVTADGFTTDLAYTSEGITNMYLVSEAENLGTGLSTAATSFTSRVSGGLIVSAAQGRLLTLPAGKYIITVGAIGGSATQVQNIVVKAGENTVASGSCNSNFLSLIAGEEFTLNGTTDITFTNSNSSNDRGIDLVYVQKTGDVELPANATATLGKNGYATFASAYDLDLSNLSGVKAYTASLSGNELSFTECTDKVVAGTGLLLKGTADAEVSIPVATADAAAVAGNALTGVTAATDLKSDAESNYIFVMKKAENAAEELTFLPLATESVTVPAGKAYVTVAASEFAESRSLSIKFSDETTAISKVQNAEVANGSYYNLNGQRVATPAKGLYIVNGKKVIVNN